MTAARCARDDFKLRVWNETVASLSSRGSLGRRSPMQVLKNHAGTVSYLAPGVAVLSTEDEIVRVTRSAREAGRRIRVTGSRHSYNECFYSPSILISLERFTDIGPIDEETLTVEVGAGVTLRELCDYLDGHGYALRYIGSHGHQTVIGAAVTGTHGFCREGGLIAELIVALRVVTGQGDLVSITD